MTHRDFFPRSFVTLIPCFSPFFFFQTQTCTVCTSSTRCSRETQSFPTCLKRLNKHHRHKNIFSTQKTNSISTDATDGKQMSSSFTCGAVCLRTRLAEGGGAWTCGGGGNCTAASERDRPLGIIVGQRVWPRRRRRARDL